MNISEVHALASLSARIGKDKTLIQGAGGNSSVKCNGVLWVKASGKWLADALDMPVFVPVDLNGVRARIAAGCGDDLSGLTVGPDCTLRPSIETTLHALMPHPVVLHVHSLNVLAWAVRQDAQARLAERLAGLAYSFVPYARPGLPLTEAVAAAMSGHAVDILILANHGVVVGAADCEQAEALLQEVENRLEIAPRHAGNADLSALTQRAAGTGYHVPADPAAHLLAFDPAGRMATAGSLYPDHVVFLGSGLPFLNAAAAWPATAKAVVIEGVGVLVAESLSPGGEAMVAALAELATRLDPAAALSYLPLDAEAALLGWDAEQYRQTLQR